MTPLVIPVGVSGLTLADFAFRLYADAAPVALPVGVTIAEDSALNYSVFGLPEPSAVHRTLTWLYPGGGSGSKSYSRLAAPPQYTVIPVRIGGLVTADFELLVYLDGVLRADVLSTLEIGSPGDYRVGGWPTNLAGSWLLVARYLGQAVTESWKVEPWAITTTVRVLSMEARHEPFTIGLDPKGRTMWSVNFDAITDSPLQRWEEAIARLLSDSGVGTAGVDIFAGQSVVPPVGDGPFISVISSGGTSPLYIHNQPQARHARPSVQVVVTAKSFDAGRSRVLAAYGALDGIRDTTVAA